MEGTSGRQRVPTDTVAKFQFNLPPLPEQKTIAHILGTLDDKIELNRRMNATLEAMAQALFQSWFVDFDPVRAKLDGRHPAGLDAVTAAIFPDHFQDSPLGHIPQNWTAGTLSEGFNLTMGQSPPGDTYNEDGNGIPFYQGRTDFGFRFPTRRIYCTAPTRYAKPTHTRFRGQRSVSITPRSTRSLHMRLSGSINWTRKLGGLNEMRRKVSRSDPLHRMLFLKLFSRVWTMS